MLRLGDKAKPPIQIISILFPECWHTLPILSWIRQPDLKQIHHQAAVLVQHCGDMIHESIGVVTSKVRGPVEAKIGVICPTFPPLRG